MPHPLHIDEIQLGGDPLVRAVKLVVDLDWTLGQFILSASARFLTVPTLSESLAGRAGLIDLWPLSVGERVGGEHNFIDRVFSARAAFRDAVSDWSRSDYLRTICDGGYPEVLRLRSPGARQAWFESYLDTVIQRDVREFVHIQRLRALPDLLALVAGGRRRPRRAGEATAIPPCWLRPRLGTCALTTTRPPRPRAIPAASSGVEASAPSGIATPAAAVSRLASCSSSGRPIVIGPSQELP
jgi:hypothetical protein